MDITSRLGLATRLSFGSTAIVTLLVGLMAFAPAVAAETEDGIQLAASERPLVLGDLAGEESPGGKEFLLGAVWQNRGVSYVRWTGSPYDFEAAEPLRGGFRATDPRVAVCGGRLLAASVWKTTAGDTIGIDNVVNYSGPRSRFVLAAGYRPDIACDGNVVAVTYMSGELARLAIFDAEGCGNPCVPAFQYNLGAAPYFGRATVATTDVGFVVSWMGPGIYVQRFLVSWPASGITVSPKPLINVGNDSWYPQIAADGARVVIAYGRRGQTHMRIRRTAAAPSGLGSWFRGSA